MELSPNNAKLFNFWFDNSAEAGCGGTNATCSEVICLYLSNSLFCTQMVQLSFSHFSKQYFSTELMNISFLDFLDNISLRSLLSASRQTR